MNPLQLNYLYAPDFDTDAHPLQQDHLKCYGSIIYPHMLPRAKHWPTGEIREPTTYTRVLPRVNELGKKIVDFNKIPKAVWERQRDAWPCSQVILPARVGRDSEDLVVKIHYGPFYLTDEPRISFMKIDTHLLDYGRVYNFNLPERENHGRPYLIFYGERCFTFQVKSFTFQRKDWFDSNDRVIKNEAMRRDIVDKNNPYYSKEKWRSIADSYYAEDRQQLEFLENNQMLLQTLRYHENDASAWIYEIFAIGEEVTLHPDDESDYYGYLRRKDFVSAKFESVQEQEKILRYIKHFLQYTCSEFSHIHIVEKFMNIYFERRANEEDPSNRYEHSIAAYQNEYAYIRRNTFLYFTQHPNVTSKLDKGEMILKPGEVNPPYIASDKTLEV